MRGRTEDVDRPLWTRHQRVLWTEDDATLHDPDAERVHDAWLRLFGETLNRDARLATWDGGDTFAYLYPGGRVEWHSYDGHRVALAKIVAVLDGKKA